jgi:lipoate-protein ligase A
MHGAYKTPGGKLVQVDFDVVNGLLVNVAVSGDFFLYPEEALDAITASLEGTDRTLTTVERIALIANAIAADTTWLGSSPEALATAVERALANVDSND